MKAILIPSFDSVAEALDFVERHGTPIRVCLLEGDDGKIRGNAMVEDQTPS